MSTQSLLPVITVPQGPIKARYTKLLSWYFIALTISFPVQIYFLKDLNPSDSINWMDFMLQIPFLNWVCMAAYTATAAALNKRSSKLWAFLTGSLLLTAINNAFVAFAGWDYSLFQIFSGTALFALPLVPTVLSTKYRQMIWTKKQTVEYPTTASPRFKKRWRVELVTPGQEVPTTGITVNISDSGALVHMISEKSEQSLFDVRITEPHQGLILDCKAERVREDIIPLSRKKKLPVMGIKFVSLTEEQKAKLQNNLYKTRPGG